MIKIIKYLIVLIVLMITVSLCHPAMQENIDRNKIVKLLEEAYLRDQAPRLIIDSLMRSGATDGNLFLPAITQQREADSINIKVVLPIIDTLYKYKIYDLDPIAYKGCWTVIQHADNEVMFGYTDFVEQLAKRDLIAKSSYMAFADRLQIRQKKAQIYGYQFHRFSNGTIIQFPILEGQDERWKKLGCTSKMDSILPSEYNVNYPATHIEKDQFICIGFIYEGESDFSLDDCLPVGRAKILVNEQEITTTDSTGYFSLLLDKKKLPSSIQVLINEIPVEYKIEQNKEMDFSISVGYFNKEKIDVVTEK